MASFLPPDIPAEEPSKDAIQRLSDLGILPTFPDGLFRGVRPASRYEAGYFFVLLNNRIRPAIVKIKRKPELPDIPDNVTDVVGIPGDIRVQLMRLGSAGILHLYPDGLFRGNRAVSGQEVIVLAARQAVVAGAISSDALTNSGANNQDVDAQELSSARAALRSLIDPKLPEKEALEAVLDEKKAMTPVSRYQLALLVDLIARHSKTSDK